MKQKVFIFSNVHKLLLVIFVGILLVCCKKSPDQVLKKGKWRLDWNDPTFQHFKGTIEFKKNGQGEFSETGDPQLVPFLYTISGSKRTFQWYNPSFQNTVNEFDVVTIEDDRQVWEETKPNKGSRFIITK